MSIQDTATGLGADEQLSSAGARVKSRTGLRYFLRSFASDSPLNIVALVIIAIFIFMSLLGPTLAPYNAIKPDILHKFQGPSL
ncbi:MAG TPA: hypothetical protein VFI42_18810, partial [Thermomicrobiaceae bacterium]|nr:hypothetical protein [Thermomicrobiaceae bacterium]